MCLLLAFVRLALILLALVLLCRVLFLILLSLVLIVRLLALILGLALLLGRLLLLHQNVCIRVLARRRRFNVTRDLEGDVTSATVAETMDRVTHSAGRLELGLLALRTDKVQLVRLLAVSGDGTKVGRARQ